MPSVSICLPVLNGERYLEKAIESALIQTYTDFELLIADDGSTDNSWAIASRYAQQDKRIVAWKNEKSFGLFGNYNLCTSRASGRYIKLFAQDDIFHPDLVQRLLNVLEENPSVSLVASARCPIDANGKSIQLVTEADIRCAKPFMRDVVLKASNAISSILYEGINWLGEPSSQMYRAEHVETGFNSSFLQLGDLENSFRLLMHGDYYFVSDALCYFRKHDESSSAANKRQMASHLEWLLLAAVYQEYLSTIDLTSEEFCLNFIKSWTRDLESELNANERLGDDDRYTVLHEIFGDQNLLSGLSIGRNKMRDTTSEYKVLCAITLMHATLLEHEIRTIHREVANLQVKDKRSVVPMVQVRHGLVKALEGLEQTLRERDKEILALRARLSDIGESVSWKITAPLRALKQNFRKCRC
jgi:glycosyltransferase involved in cell wall biosynthesis